MIWFCRTFKCNMCVFTEVPFDTSDPFSRFFYFSVVFSLVHYLYLYYDFYSWRWHAPHALSFQFSLLSCVKWNAAKFEEHILNANVDVLLAEKGVLCTLQLGKLPLAFISFPIAAPMANRGGILSWVYVFGSGCLYWRNVEQEKRDIRTLKLKIALQTSKKKVNGSKNRVHIIQGCQNQRRIQCFSFWSISLPRKRWLA